MLARGARKDRFDDFGNPEERQTILEKGRDSHFIGGVQGAGQCSALLEGFAGKAKAGKAARGGFLEVEATEFSPIELDLLRSDPGGIRQRVLDGHAHVGGGELRQHGAIHEFDERVDGGLGMNDHFDLVGAHIEQPVGLDDFEALIHHGRGVNGDAVAHAPVGMMEGLLRGDIGELGERRFTERATGGGEDEATNFGVRTSAQALVNGVMFGIDGEELPSRFRRCGHHQFAGSNQDFFVGKSNGPAKFDRFVSGLKADHTDGRGDDDVRIGMRADSKHSSATVMDRRKRLVILGAEETGQFVGEWGSGDRNDFGMVTEDLRDEFVEIIACSEGSYSELIGK